MVTDGNQTYLGDNFEMYRNIKTLYCVTGANIVSVGQLYFKNNQSNKLIEKQIRFTVTRSGGTGEGGLDEDSQKVQNSSYKINKYQEHNVYYDKHNQHFSMLYMKVVKKVNSKSSHQKEKNLFLYFFYFVSI